FSPGTFKKIRKKASRLENGVRSALTPHLHEQAVHQNTQPAGAVYGFAATRYAQGSPEFPALAMVNEVMRNGDTNIVIRAGQFGQVR
ncbi:MAG: hypothetical protein H7829_12885, partial [Magnetococcus sp. THC-1_WYH]